MKKALKIIGIILLTIVAFVAVFFGILTIREYRPDKEEKVEFYAGDRAVHINDMLTVATFNIGYGAYDTDENFFMDGGEKVRPDSEDDVWANLSGIVSVIKELDADVIFFQEIDLDSRRSYHINEQTYIESAVGQRMTWACNYRTFFVPFPMPPIGKVESGIATMTDLAVGDATRFALPEAFSWPVKTANLKRCMLEERIPIEGSDKELVLINFHLEAYDDGDGKIAQTKVLMDKLSEEYEMGNYVIAGGDFNQTFDCITAPPVINPDAWSAGQISVSDLPEGYSFAVNDNVATCRSLAEEFVDYDISQTYIIDGFAVSDNFDVLSVRVIDKGFEYSDHNPVMLSVRLK